jgi:hypothetical protein
MHGEDVDEFPEEIKPGEGLNTPEWWEFTRKLSLTERGLALSLLILMHLRGWRSIHHIPVSNPELANIFGCSTLAVNRLRARLTANADIFHAQLARVSRWPAWIIAEFEP